MKYNLRLRKANEYKGKIPATLGSELVKFIKENNIQTGSNPYYSDFFIIAPPKMFIDYKSYGKRLADKLEEERLRKLNDPILLFKVSENRFVIVKSWGNDETLFRRISGILNSTLVMGIMGIFIPYVLPLLLTILWFTYFPFPEHVTNGWHLTLRTIYYTIPITFWVVNLIDTIQANSEDKSLKQRIYEAIYESRTENNWDYKF